MFVLLQLLLHQREHLFAHQHWYRDLNPLRAQPLVPANVAAGQDFPLTKVPRDALPGPLLGFAIAGRSPICGIAQHAPNRGSLPAALPRPCWNLAFIH